MKANEAPRAHAREEVIPSNNNTCSAPKGRNVNDTKKRAHDSWYVRASQDDPLRTTIDLLARRCAYKAKMHKLDRSELFSAACVHVARLLREQPDLPTDKIVNRSVSWGFRQIMLLDFAERNVTRLRRQGSADDAKWVWKLSDAVVEIAFPSLRAKLKADADSHAEDAFVEAVDAGLAEDCETCL